MLASRLAGELGQGGSNWLLPRLSAGAYATPPDHMLKVRGESVFETLPSLQINIKRNVDIHYNYLQHFALTRFVIAPATPRRPLAKNEQWSVTLDAYHRFVVERMQAALGHRALTSSSQWCALGSQNTVIR